MYTLEFETTTTGSVGGGRNTKVIPEEALARPGLDKAKDVAGWRTVINEPLIDWGRNPGQLEDEGITPPSRDFITSVLEYAMYLRDSGLSAPDKIVPNGDAGIAFEKWSDGWYEIIEFENDGSVELIVFRGDELVSRKELTRMNIS